MAEEEAEFIQKVRRAVRLLLFQRHRSPGIRGWELRKSLGKDYVKILELARRQLDELGLEIRVVYEQAEEPAKPTEEQLERARFYVVAKGPISPTEAHLSGWRVDELAMLSVALAYLYSKHGKASRGEVEQLLKEKFPEWVVGMTLDRFIKRGYLSQDEQDMLYAGWKARAEIDSRTLLQQVMGKEVGLK
ncbi:MAG: hypothetical protein QMC89_04050 [Candidatus Hodarchaeaceae archaeon]|nr:hypothetical protein [Candidatus Hodarchaeaceae archaeon]